MSVFSFGFWVVLFVNLVWLCLVVGCLFVLVVCCCLSVCIFFSVSVVLGSSLLFGSASIVGWLFDCCCCWSNICVSISCSSFPSVSSSKLFWWVLLWFCTVGCHRCT